MGPRKPLPLVWPYLPPLSCWSLSSAILASTLSRGVISVPAPQCLWSPLPQMSICQNSSCHSGLSSNVTSSETPALTTQYEVAHVTLLHGLVVSSSQHIMVLGHYLIFMWVSSHWILSSQAQGQGLVCLVHWIVPKWRQPSWHWVNVYWITESWLSSLVNNWHSRKI